MKYFIQYAFALGAVVYAPHIAHSQDTIVANDIRISDITMQRASGYLDIGMDMDFTNLKIKPNRSLHITPMLTDGNRYVELPMVVVDGRRRCIMRKRNEADSIMAENIYIRRRNRRTQDVEYDADVPYERWMGKSKLLLQQEWYACGDKSLSSDIIMVGAMKGVGTVSTSQYQTQHMRQPVFAYVIPADNPDICSVQGCSSVYFPVNKSGIESVCADQKSEMMDICNALDTISGNAISSVHIMGYASPEGPYENNRRLAANRAAAVKDFLVSSDMVDASLVTVDSAPTDWNALKQMLADSHISNRRHIIAIIDDPAIAPEDKDSEIRRKFPVEYDFMLRTFYPKMRVTDYTINYTPRTYTADEALQLVYTHPGRLRPSEIYNVAQSFEKGSKEWNDIMYIAVKTYPQSPELRVNAANVAIANGDYTRAASYLEGVPDTMPEAVNTRGILAMIKGDYAQSLTLFRQAYNGGVEEAAHNISLLEKL